MPYLYFGKFFPTMAAGLVPAIHRRRGGTGHAHLGRPLRPRPAAPGAGAAFSDTRGADADDPLLDRTQPRPHPQALSVLSRPGRLLYSPPSRSIAPPGRLLHAHAQDPTGSRGVGKLFFARRSGAGGP